jgi:hypothetical protein
LSAIILFSVTQYINKSKDSSISGNLATLVTAGEVFYDGNSSSYQGFCDPGQNSVIKNAISQMPQNPSGDCLTGLTPGVCCYVANDGNSWAACAKELADPSKAYCVDSRGMKKEISNSGCNNSIAQSSTVQCPE